MAYMIKQSGAWKVCVDGKTAPTAFQGFLKGSNLDFIGPNRLRALALRQGKAGAEFIKYELDIR